MKNYLQSLFICLMAGACFLALPAQDAHAGKGIPLVYNTGEDIFVAGDGSIPAPFNEAPELAGAQAGYKCEILGVLWAYFSISDCKPVAFIDDTFWDDAELSAAIAQLHPEDTMNVGLWSGYGIYLMGLLVLAALGLIVWSKLEGADEETQEQPAG